MMIKFKSQLQKSPSIGDMVYVDDAIEHAHIMIKYEKNLNHVEHGHNCGRVHSYKDYNNGCI